MKKIVLVLLLLGVTTLEAKPKYRIETWFQDGYQYFLPQKKVWYKTNYFPLPFKVWISADYPFQNKYQAEEIIKNWDQLDTNIKKYKNSEFIYIK
jgi:hypothetical protein